MENEPMLIPERLSEMMDRRGWGPGELAYQSGASYDVIYKLLNTQRSRTSATVVAKLALALGCSVEYLLGMTEQVAPIAGEREPIVEIMARLNQERRQQVVEYAGYLAMLDQVPGEAVRNLRDLRSVMSVLRRSTSPEVLEEFVRQLSAEFPNIADTVASFVLGDTLPPPEQKRVNRG